MIRICSGVLRIYDSKDPIEGSQMGIVSHSCTNITSGSNSFAAIANIVDGNKKVIYACDAKDNRKLGRVLAVLTSKGIVTHRIYDNSNLDTSSAWIDFLHTYASNCNTPLIVPESRCNSEARDELISLGAKLKTVSTRLHKAVCTHWYDDNVSSRVEIGAFGYRMRFKAYVLK